MSQYISRTLTLVRDLVTSTSHPLSSSLVELTEDILKQLMDLVFTLVCNGELSLARVLRKNILDKVEQKKLLRYTNSLKPLAARGVSARYHLCFYLFRSL